MQFLNNILATLVLTCLTLSGSWSTPIFAAEQVRNIGTQRELFIDDGFIGKLTGNAVQELHHPVPKNIALKHDEPWEGTGSGYHSIFKDGDIYRMYYKAWHIAVGEKSINTGQHPLFCCYAESKDGINWVKPNLGICEFQGSKNNNIILYPGQFEDSDADPGHPAVFIDDNPDCPPESKYKMVMRCNGKLGLTIFHSADGIYFSPYSKKRVITDGAFDSQNLAFWDPVRKEYRAYWRYFTAGTINNEAWKPAGIRAIRTATSKDLLHWNTSTDLTYVDSPNDELYTNQIKPYYRAPHIFIGFPTRYVERGWNRSMKNLPEKEHRRRRSNASNRYGMALTEGLLMSSRDGSTFKRWNEAFLAPGIERPGTWQYGHNYIGWHLIETKSDLPDAPNELSLFANESYWTGKGCDTRRYSIRVDGFVSVSAPHAGGELITEPFRFTGKELSLNFATSAAGKIQVEIQTPAGNPIPGYSLKENDVLFGNTLDRKVSWNDNADVSSLVGKPVQLRFVLQDADLYSLKFE